MCVFHKIKKIVLLLITGVGLINAVSAQLVYKVGDKPFSIHSDAALEVASTKGGFLPPRMSEAQRNGIISSTAADKEKGEGLIVWCNDCKTISTNPSGGELCVYLVKKLNPLVTNWVSFTASTISGLISISDPTVTNGNSRNPGFNGTLTINAGTPVGTITEYGYYSGGNNPPTTNDKPISDAVAITALNAKLNTATGTTTVDLTVNNYTASGSGSMYFRYYVIANGETIFSNVINFSPP